MQRRDGKRELGGSDCVSEELVGQAGLRWEDGRTHSRVGSSCEASKVFVGGVYKPALVIFSVKTFNASCCAAVRCPECPESSGGAIGTFRSGSSASESKERGVLALLVGSLWVFRWAKRKDMVVWGEESDQGSRYQ